MVDSKQCVQDWGKIKKKFFEFKFCFDAAL